MPSPARAWRARLHRDPYRNCRNRSAGSVPERAPWPAPARCGRRRCSRTARPTPASARPRKLLRAYPRRAPVLPSHFARLFSSRYNGRWGNRLSTCRKNMRRARRAQADARVKIFGSGGNGGAPASRREKREIHHRFWGLRMTPLLASPFLDANRVARSGAHDGVARARLASGGEIARHLRTHEFHERFHLLVHLRHLVAHV